MVGWPVKTTDVSNNLLRYRLSLEKRGPAEGQSSGIGLQLRRRLPETLVAIQIPVL